MGHKTYGAALVAAAALAAGQLAGWSNAAPAQAERRSGRAGPADRRRHARPAAQPRHRRGRRLRRRRRGRGDREPGRHPRHVRPRRGGGAPRPVRRGLRAHPCRCHPRLRRSRRHARRARTSSASTRRSAARRSSAARSWSPCGPTAARLGAGTISDATSRARRPSVAESDAVATARAAVARRAGLDRVDAARRLAGPLGLGPGRASAAPAPSGARGVWRFEVGDGESALRTRAGRRPHGCRAARHRRPPVGLDRVVCDNEPTSRAADTACTSSLRPHRGRSAVGGHRRRRRPTTTPATVVRRSTTTSPAST